MEVSMELFPQRGNVDLLGASAQHYGFPPWSVGTSNGIAVISVSLTLSCQ